MNYVNKHMMPTKTTGITNYFRGKLFHVIWGTYSKIMKNLLRIASSEMT